MNVSEHILVQTSGFEFLMSNRYVQRIEPWDHARPPAAAQLRRAPGLIVLDLRQLFGRHVLADTASELVAIRCESQARGDPVTLLADDVHLLREKLDGVSPKPLPLVPREMRALFSGVLVLPGTRRMVMVMRDELDPRNFAFSLRRHLRRAMYVYREQEHA